MSRATRWCPTPEQLIILQELYRGGLRTPKAPLIQKITAHLSLYGKIQGKNVFYWFQNHKARDRQKLRKILSKQLLFEQQEMNYIQTNHLVNPHLHSNPHPSGYHHQPQHGSATFICQVCSGSINV
ncbi:hypothetical protein Leryth_016499 [Lithospermum erythrorhizon]|nr:hypothetical protein Leryth_016499 [Lithospermum erythrorhizon]